MISMETNAKKSNINFQTYNIICNIFLLNIDLILYVVNMNILVQCIYKYAFYPFFSQRNYAAFLCFDLNSINDLIFL